MSSDGIRWQSIDGLAGKRLRDDAKQCKIVLLRYAKALDNIIVIKCN